MGNWLSIAAAVFLAVMVLYGHYKGFIRLAVSAVALLVTLFVVQTATPQITGYLKQNTGIYQVMENGVRKALGFDESIETEEPAKQRETIEDMSLPKQIKEALLENNNYEIYDVLGVDTFEDYISGYLTNGLLNIVGFLILFAVVFAVIHLLTSWLDLFAKLPILSGINKLAGAILGAAEGLFLLWLIFLLITIFGGTGIGKNLLAQIDASKWLSFLYDNNMLNHIVMTVVKNIL